MEHFQEVYEVGIDRNWCMFSNSKKIWMELFVVFCTVVCFFFLVIYYGKIYKTVANNNVRKRGIRKLVFTTALLLGNFALCWCPLVIFEITMWAVVSRGNSTPQGGHPESLLTLHNVCNTLFLSHPFLDPIVYVARLPNVHRYVVKKYSCLWNWVSFKKIRDKVGLQRTNSASGKTIDSGLSATGNRIAGDECDEVPLNYNYEHFRISRLLRSTLVQLTPVAINLSLKSSLAEENSRQSSNNNNNNHDEAVL